MGKGAAAGRFAPGGSQHGSSRLGTSRRTPRAGLVPDKRAPALKREQNSSYLLQSAIAQSVRAPAASAPVLLRPGLGTSIQKEQLQKKAAGTRAAPRGVTASSPLSPSGMGAEAWVHPRVLPQGTRRAILGTCSDAGGAGEVSPMRSPCSSWFWGVWVGFFFFFGRWILRCSSASCFLPNTQGPRRAFKIPFITMEPPRLRAQAEGPGGGFWGVGFGGGVFFRGIFCFKFSLKNKIEVCSLCCCGPSSRGEMRGGEGSFSP